MSSKRVPATVRNRGKAKREPAVPLSAGTRVCILGSNSLTL